jgi:hypothetical protein
VDWSTTLVLLILSLGGFGFSSWRASRPAEFGKVRMIPWTALSIICAVFALFMLIHAVNLAGIKTGNRSAQIR